MVVVVVQFSTLCCVKWSDQVQLANGPARYFGNECCTIHFFLSVSQSVLLESGPLVEDDHSIVVADQGNPAGQIVTIVPHRRCLGRFVDGHYGGSVVT
jgi:hypothetical protein